MPKSLALVALLVLSLTSLPSRAQATDPAAALVAAVSGPARTLVLPAGGGTLAQATSAPVRSLDSLASGTILQLGQGATATLAFHADGHREDLAGPLVVQITPGGSHLIKGDAACIVRRDSEVAEAVSPDHTLARAEVAPGTELDIRNDGDGLNFSWTTGTPGPYIVTVFDPGPPRHNVWSSESAGTDVEYRGANLTPGTTYMFQVEAGGSPLGAMRFQVPTAATVESLGAAAAEVQATPQDPASLAMLAVAQDQQGNLDVAVQTMQSAIDQRPDDVGFINRMQAMVTEMGDEARANVLQNRAKFIEDSMPAMDYDDMTAYVTNIEGVYLP